MTLLDVQHIKKIYKTRFHEIRIEAPLKDILPLLRRVNTWPSWGNQDLGTLLNILAMQSAADRRVGFHGTDISTIKNKTPPATSAGKTWLRLARFQFT